MTPRIALAVVLAVAAYACGPTDPRRTVAEQFIDRLYVMIDQNAARDLATGLAVAKIDEELRLKGGQAIDDGTRKPHVSYAFVERKGADTDPIASLIYELRVQPEGAEEFTKRLFLTLREVSGQWRVANYTLDSPPGA